ncbi:MAG: hypothetical protein K2J81_04105 [Treponemataceae bacterium]|nr:hypothetical protein [Treponemataceae bacterium]
MNLTIKQEWYEAAAEMSGSEQRAAFYDMVTRYFFAGESPSAEDHAGRPTETAYVMFMLVRPEIDRERHGKELRRARKDDRRRTAADRKQATRRPAGERAATAGKPGAARFVKPTAGEVAAYCNEKGYAMDAEQFVSYYESNGWRVGRNAMKDWKSAVTSWVKRKFDTARNKQAGAMYGKEDKIPDSYIDLV